MTKQTPAQTATIAQRRASDPNVSAWVSANAGSGKTHVLVNRVVRLLLSDCPPEKILCLTFTKAAASEMANRLFRMLGHWVTLDDAELSEQLYLIEGAAPSPDRLPLARRLFAKAVETPGGLKVQTIHAFCESVLQRFPIEADIPPGFDVLDTRGSKELLDMARHDLLTRAMHDEGLRLLLDRANDYFSEGSLNAFIDEALASRASIQAAFGAAGGLVEVADGLRALFDLEPGESSPSVVEQATGMAPDREQSFRSVMDVAASGKTRDRNFAEQIAQILLDEDRFSRFQRLCALFLTQKGTPRKDLLTSQVANENPDIAEWFRHEQGRVVAWRGRYWSAVVVEVTLALLGIVADILNGYEDAKRARAQLDYSDLITRTVELLNRSQAAWVLYKLDNGLDHILVDEAQDTSPEQWEVIKRLSEEFFVGEGSRPGTRTVFAVGDEKQSIYSFQGARPAQFEMMRRFFRNSVNMAQKAFETVPLTVSFRSTRDIMRAVDTVFSDPRAASGLVFGADSAGSIVHEAVRVGRAGRIEIWPTTVPQEIDDDGNAWDAPLDRPGPKSPRVMLAETIAATIKRWLADEVLDTRGRKVVPGDILILVRRRDAFSDAMVRTLKRENIPVAGADRLILTSHIAVLDLLALARFVLTPLDDLALASVLKSPLVCKTDGSWFDDDDLFRLTYQRPGTLWASLAGQADSDRDFGLAFRQLHHWRAQSQRLPPHEYFSAILGPNMARQRFIARLGSETADPLDEFLNLTLQYEMRHVPTLQGFVSWLEEAETEIKRDMEHGRNEVRIMTVHGAKGLEANLVILPDTCSVPHPSHDPGILFLYDEAAGTGDVSLPVWAGRAGDDTPVMKDARDKVRTERDEEYHRLLYVAMTRARDRLYVCGYEGRQGRSPGCWYDLIADNLKPQAEEIDLPGGSVGWRLSGESTGVADEDDAGGDRALAPTEPPAWARQAAPPEPPLLRPLAPSRLEAAETDGTVLATQDQISLSPLSALAADRFLRGRVIHKLLQYMPSWPPQAREDKAAAYVAKAATAMSSGQREDIIHEVLQIVDDARFSELFSGESRAEVPLTAQLPITGPDGRAVVISGQVDRIAVTPTRVMVVDYKTNRPPPDTVDGVAILYLRQMAAYRMALMDLFPDRTVECHLLWTDGPRLMALPGEMLDNALAGLAPDQ